MVKASYFGLFGDGNDGWAFEAAGNFAQLQRSVEDLCKVGGQFFRQAGEIPSGSEAFQDFLDSPVLKRYFSDVGFFFQLKSTD